MLVSVSGYNYSGSSAVIDLLAEYSETNCVKQEIAFAYMPDGLLDLEYNMNHTATYFNGDVAIQRFWNQCLRCDMPKDKNSYSFKKAGNTLIRLLKILGMVDPTLILHVYQGRNIIYGT